MFLQIGCLSRHSSNSGKSLTGTKSTSPTREITYWLHAFFDPQTNSWGKWCHSHLCWLFNISTPQRWWSSSKYPQMLQLLM